MCYIKVRQIGIEIQKPLRIGGQSFFGDLRLYLLISLLIIIMGQSQIIIPNYEVQEIILEVWDDGKPEESIDLSTLSRGLDTLCSQRESQNLCPINSDTPREKIIERYPNGKPKRVESNRSNDKPSRSRIYWLCVCGSRFPRWGLLTEHNINCKEYQMEG